MPAPTVPPPASTPAARLTVLPWHRTAERMLDAHRLILLVGEPGSGKTSWALQASYARTGREAEVIQGTPETELGHLWGTYTLVDGATRFLDGPLPAALKEGGLLVVEEMSLIPLETRAALLALRGVSVIRNPFTGDRLAIPPAFRLVATSNPESMRCYRNGKIAQALYDDFLTLEVPSPTEEHIAAMVESNFPGTATADRQDALGRWRRLADVANKQENKLGLRLGYRSVAHFLALRAKGLEADEAAAVAYVNKYFLDEDAHQAAKFSAMLRPLE